MNARLLSLLSIFAVFGFAILACSAGAGTPIPTGESLPEKVATLAPDQPAGDQLTKPPTQGILSTSEPAEVELPPVPGAPETYDSPFPLPESLSNFLIMENGSTNFQTKMSLKEAISFYQQKLSEEGFSERAVLHGETETTFSMVFAGAPNGKSVVVQGVDLGNGMININIRYEDVD